MIITKKAMAGFILLAMITFLTTDYTVSHMHGPPSNVNPMTGKIEPMAPDILKHEPSSYMRYNPPIIALGKNAPIVLTALIELFTLGCYLVLKKYEPEINEAAADIVVHYK